MIYILYAFVVVGFFSLALSIIVLVVGLLLACVEEATGRVFVIEEETEPKPVENTKPDVNTEAIDNYFGYVASPEKPQKPQKPRKPGKVIKLVPKKGSYFDPLIYVASWLS